MDIATEKPLPMQHFLMNDWIVSPSENLLQRGKTRIHLEPKAMDVLCHLSKNPECVVSAEQLLAGCWPEHDLGDSVVYKNIAILRKALGERIDGTSYIATIPKRGYRLQAKVVPLVTTNIHQLPVEEADFEEALRTINKLTLKHIRNEGIASHDLSLLKRNSKRLEKISQRLLHYLTGIPRMEDSK